jgi:hypothetical protein
MFLCLIFSLMKQVIINVKNEDNKCLLGVNPSALHPANKDPQKVTKYIQREQEFDEALNGIEFPVKLSDVSKFAKRTNIAMNVYYFNNGSMHSF